MPRRRSRPTWFTLALIVIGLGMSQWEHCHPPPDAYPPADAPTSDGARRTDPKTPTPPSPVAAEPQAPLGVPGPASADPSARDHFLIDRPQYVCSYNADRGIPNWVAWHLAASDLGDANRSQFEPDGSLPPVFYRVTPNDYRGSGFDRGHMCPSGDRTSSPENNRMTFRMTNVVPQAPDNNQGPWNDFEIYCRELARRGSELYIVCGPAGPFDRTLAGGHVAVPSSVWKVVVVLSQGDDDLARVGESTRVIALSVPNHDGIKGQNWKTFRVSVDSIEATTGLDLLSNVPERVQAVLEARIDK